MRDYPRAVRRVGAVTAAATIAGTAFTGILSTSTALASTVLDATASTLPGPAAPTWCRPGGTLSARAMPRRVKIADCDLRGRTVRGANGLTVVVPSDGTSVVVHELRTDGGAELRIEVDDRDGEITIDALGGRVPQGRPRGFRAPAAACTDGTYRLEPSKWPKGTTVRWHYSSGMAGLPSAPFAKGIANMVGARTDCASGGRYTSPPDVAERYAGQTAQHPNITAAAACGRRDGANTFGWLAMPAADRGVLAATCMWFSGPTTIETDMALQTLGKRWWTSGSCRPGSYSAEAVVTHESGHVFGLGHVGGIRHQNLTMAPSIRSCSRGPATLGKGDYDGLIALYGGR